MPTIRPFCYNPTQVPISGMEQVGDIAAGTSSVVIDPSKQWWNGPNEDLGYIIAYVDATGDHANGPERVLNVNFVCHIGFKRSLTKTEADFVTLAKKVLNTNAISSGDDAKIQLNAAGYWTSWGAVAALGASPETAATSAIELLQAGITTNDWYYIKTSSMTSPRLVYCNMTDEGGGWMLMNYNPDLNTHYGNPYPNEWMGGQGSFDGTTTFDYLVHYQGTYSSGPNIGEPISPYGGFTYNPTYSVSGKWLSINAMDLWYNNGVAQCSEVMKMASPTTNLAPILSNMEIANKISYTNPNNLLLTATFAASKFVDGFTSSGNWGGYDYPTNSFTNQRVDRVVLDGLTPLIVNKTSMIGTWSAVKGHTKMGSRLVTAPGDWIIQTNSLWSVADSYYYIDGEPDPGGGDQSGTEYYHHHLSAITNGAGSAIRPINIYSPAQTPASFATSSIWGMADVYHDVSGWTYSVVYDPNNSNNNHFNNSGNVLSFSATPLEPQTATMSNKRLDLRTFAIYIR